MNVNSSNPFAALLAAALVSASSSQAATKTWDAGGGDLLWNTGNNWNTNGTPANGDTIVFANTFTSGTAIDLNGDRTINDLSITGTTSFSLNNNTLTITSGDIDRSATTGTTTINSGILLGGDGAWIVNGTGTLVANGVIDDGANTFGLDKTDTGTLTLNNANTFGGTLIVNGGTVSLGNNSAAGLGTLDLSGGTLQAAGAARTLTNTVLITGNSTVGGSLDLTFNGDVSESNSFTLAFSNTGITTFAGSTLTLAPNNATDNLTFDIDGTSGGVVVDSVVQNGTGTGADGLIKNGSGSLTLNNINTFTGNLTLNEGTLILGHNSAAGAGTLVLDGATIEGAGGTRSISNNLSITGNNTFGGAEDLEFTDSFDQGAGRVYTVNNTTTFSGSISGNNTLDKSGTGTLILSGDNLISTVTVNTGGALRISHNNALGAATGSTVVNDGGALELIGGRTIGAEALSLRGSGVAGSGALRNISGNNSWAGDITLTNNAQVHRINSDAGTLTITGNISETGNTDNKDLTFGGSGNIIHTGNITLVGTNDIRLFKDGSGTLTLSGVNTYDGTTTIGEGTLLANNASGSATGTGAVFVNTDGTLGGTGTITPGTANGINVTGVLAPGGSVAPGNLTFNLGSTTGTVSMASGASFAYELGLSGADIVNFGSSDLLTLAGAAATDTLAFNGNDIDFLGTGAIGYYKLFDSGRDNANTWTGLTVGGTGLITAGLSVSNLAGSLTGNLIMGGNSLGGTAGDIYLQVVPEPSAALLGGIGVMFLLRRRRVA